MREQLLVACVTASALIACRAAAPEQRREQQLKDSFVQQIASTGIVRNLQRAHIDSATIEPQADGTTQDKGVVKSSWSVNDEPIRPRGSQSDLPLPFLDNGVAQECWAFWDSRSHQWSWK